MPPKAKAKGPGRSRYGLTWWGGRFLDAFNGIDFSNRLPRGVTYANNGSCSHIECRRNCVHAQVQGSEFSPYRVNIRFEDFGPGTLADKVDAAVQSLGPVIVSRLLNGELPDALLGALQTANINLFPRRWADVEARCSCPDAAVPCKHIAAVIFLTAGEIDKNPFLVFDLHNYDLRARIAALGGLPGPGVGVSVRAASSGLSPGRRGSTGTPNRPQGKSQAGRCAVSNVTEVPLLLDLVQAQADSNAVADSTMLAADPNHALVDFSKLAVADYAARVQEILKKQPMFFPKKDFRELLMLMARHWAKRATSGGPDVSVARRRCAASLLSTADAAPSTEEGGGAGRTPLCRGLLSLERLQLVLDDTNQFVGFDHASGGNWEQRRGIQKHEKNQEHAVDQRRDLARGSAGLPTRRLNSKRARSASGFSDALPDEDLADLETFQALARGADGPCGGSLGQEDEASQFLARLTIDELLDCIEYDVNAETKGAFCYDLQFLKVCVTYADTLLARCAVVPQLVRQERVSGGPGVPNTTSHFVRWVPFLAAPDVARLHSQISCLCPRNLVKILDPNPSQDGDQAGALPEQSGQQQQQQHRFVSCPEQVTLLVSVLVRRNVTKRIAENASQITYPTLPARFQGDPVMELFFGTELPCTSAFTDQTAPNHFQLKEIPRSVNLWLARLFAGEKGYRLRLLVRNYREQDGMQDYFSVAVEVEVLPKTGSCPGKLPSDSGAGASTLRAAAGLSADQTLRVTLQDTLKSKLYALKTFLGLKLISPDLKLDVMASLNLLCEHIPGFEQAMLRLGAAAQTEARNGAGSIAPSSDPSGAAGDHDYEAPQSANTPAHDLLKFHYTEFSAIFLDTLPLLEALGVRVVLPKQLRRRAVVPRLRMRVRAPAAPAGSLDGAESSSAANSTTVSTLQAAEFDWTVAVGDTEIPAKQFEALVKGSRGMVRLLDQFVVLDEGEMGRLFSRLNSLPDRLGQMEVLQAGLTGAGVDGAGEEFECTVDAKILQAVRRKLGLDAVGGGVNLATAALPPDHVLKASGGDADTGSATSLPTLVAALNGVPAVSAYARPVVEQCFRDVACGLEGPIAMELFETPVLHDAQTFDAEKELNGVERVDPRYQKPVCKLHCQVQRPAGPGALAAKTVSWSLKLLKRVDSPQQESWVANPMTRGRISECALPVMNHKVQHILYVLEDLIRESRAGQSVRSEEGLREMPDDLCQVSDGTLGTLFFRLLSACGTGGLELFNGEAGNGREQNIQKNVAFEEARDAAKKALEHPHCGEFADFVAKLLGEYEKRAAVAGGSRRSTSDGACQAGSEKATQLEKKKTPDMEARFALPEGLKATLRPYQQRGFEWLCCNVENGLGSIVGDDMGLGKTLQVLSCLLYWRNQMEAVAAEQVASASGATSLRAGKKKKVFRALVICPTSVVENWLREAAKFTPTLMAVAYRGEKAQRKVQRVGGGPPMKRGRKSAAADGLVVAAEAAGDGSADKEDAAAGDAGLDSSAGGLLDADLIVTSFSLARLASNVSFVAKTHFTFLVVDEAQNLKNPKSQQTVAVKKLKSDFRIALSGTPVENRLLEFWSIMDFCNRGWLGVNPKLFEKRFAVPIEKDGCARRLQAFHRMTRPFLLRRLKTDRDIVRDLPDKVYADESIALSAEQAGLYQGIVDEYLANGLLGNRPAGADDTDRGAATVKSEEQAAGTRTSVTGGGIARRGMILKMLGALKQVCDHPEVYLNKAGIAQKRSAGRRGGAAAPSAEQRLAAGEGEQRLAAASCSVWPQRLPSDASCLSAGEHSRSAAACGPAPSGSSAPGLKRSASAASLGSSDLNAAQVLEDARTAVALLNLNAEAQRSGKCARLLELMGTILAGGEKALIFTQFVAMGVLLSRMLEARFGGRFPFFHGGLNAGERSKLVAEFQGEAELVAGASPSSASASASRLRSMIVSLKAGGTGLTLTAASRVIHFDHWWNPAAEDQATDRAYRIGQTKKVFVHRLTASGSVEEKIMAMVEKKRRLQHLTVGEGESWLTELSGEELRELVSLDRAVHLDY